MITSRSKCRPRNNSSTLFSSLTVGPQLSKGHCNRRGRGHLHQSRLSYILALGDTHFSVGTGEVRPGLPAKTRRKRGRLKPSRLRAGPDDLSRDPDAARILQTIELE